MCDRQHSPLNLCRFSVIVFASISLAAFLCPERTAAQVTVGSVVTAADVTEPVAGDCANYNSVLSSTGVTANGQTHPGRCRATALTPLFDGAALGTSMQAFRNSHPDLFKSQRKGGTCLTSSKLNVTLSASLQATRLEWTGAPVVGAKCTNELVRVNGVSSPPSPAISVYNELLLSRLLHSAEQELMMSPPLRECNRSPESGRACPRTAGVEPAAANRRR